MAQGEGSGEGVKGFANAFDLSKFFIQRWIIHKKIQMCKHCSQDAPPNGVKPLARSGWLSGLPSLAG